MLNHFSPQLMSALIARVHESMTFGAIDLNEMKPLLHELTKNYNISPNSAERDGQNEMQAWAQRRLNGLTEPARQMILAPSGAKFRNDEGCIIAAGSSDIIGKVIALAVLASSRQSSVKVAIHPELQTGACLNKGRRWGRALLGLLAEMGLAKRPWHLYVGSKAIVDRMSPYVRDLGGALWSWGGEELSTSVMALPWHAHENQVSLYALADKFTSQSSDLAQERAEAERTCGIVHANLGGLQVGVVDLARVQPKFWDTRLPSDHPWSQNSDGTPPILIQVPASAGEHDCRSLSTLLQRFCQSLGGQALSVTFAQKAVMRDSARLHGRASSLLDCMSNWPLAGFSGDSGKDCACVDVVPWALEDDGTHVEYHDAEVDDFNGPKQAMAKVGGGAHAWAQMLLLNHRGALHERVHLNYRVFNQKASAGEDDLILDYLTKLISPTQSSFPIEPTTVKKPNSSAHRMRV